MPLVKYRIYELSAKKKAVQGSFLPRAAGNDFNFAQSSPSKSLRLPETRSIFS